MATFPNIKIDADCNYVRTPRNLTNDFGDNYSQVLPDGINAYNEQWDMKFSNRPKADIDTIKSFLDSNSGCAPFDWQAPDDAGSKQWRWIGEYRYGPAEADTRSISFTIKRYFGA